MTWDEMIAEGKRKEAEQQELAYNDSWNRMKATMPGRPAYYTGLDNETGLLGNNNLNMTAAQVKAAKLAGGDDVGMDSNLAGLEERLSGINLNKDALNALRTQALSTDPSAWALKMGATQGIEEANARDANVALNATAGNEAMSDLMMSGGFGGGAGERMARDTRRATTQGAQGVLRQGQLDRSGIGVKDEENRLSLLSQLPGMEIQALQPELEKTSMWGNLADTESNRKMNLDLNNRDYKTGVDKFNITQDYDQQKYNNDASMKSQEFNIGNALTERRNAEAAKLAQYQEEMKAWGANRTAVAQENAGK